MIEMGEQPDTERNENNQVREVSNTEQNYSMNEENENKIVQKVRTPNDESCEAMSRSIAPEQRQK